MTFLAKVGSGRWQDIGTDDNAPYRVFHDVSDIAPGTTRPATARSCSTTPATRARAPTRGARSRRPRSRSRRRPRASGVRGTRRGARDRRAGARDLRRGVRALGERRPVHDASAATTPRRSTRCSTTRRACRTGRRVTYRAVLTYAPGSTVTSDTRTVDDRAGARGRRRRSTTSGRRRSKWGLHLFGDGLAPGEATAEWTNPTPFEGTDALRRRCTGSGSRTTPSASASSSTAAADRPQPQGHRRRPLLHPARHAGDLAARRATQPSTAAPPPTRVASCRARRSAGRARHGTRSCWRRRPGAGVPGAARPAPRVPARTWSRGAPGCARRASSGPGSRSVSAIPQPPATVDQIRAERRVRALHAGLAVVAVVEHDDGEVRRLLRADGGQRAEAHQLLAVAGDDDAPERSGCASARPSPSGTAPPIAPHR